MSPLAAALPLLPCGTPNLDALPALLDLPAVHGGSAGRLERDAFTEFPHRSHSERFVVKWGDQVEVEPEVVDLILGALEASWTQLVSIQGHPDPVSEDWLFNVYIGNSDPAGPGIDNAAGYYYVDREGAPMLVLDSRTFDHTEYLLTTCAHELYHAVQDVAGHYDYVDDAAWYWEATATWASGQVYPDHRDIASNVGGYTLLTHLPLASFDYFQTGASLTEYRQYGAFLFPYYISEIAADYTAVRDTWTELLAPSPIEALRVSLARSGLDLDEVWLDHAAANVAWDYPIGGTLESYTRDYDAKWDDGWRVHAHVGIAGTAGWVRMDREKRPGHYGYDVVQLSPQLRSPVRIQVRGEPRGTHGSRARWGGRVVVDDGREVRTVDLGVDKGEADREVDLTGAVEAYVIVGAWAQTPSPDWVEERFGWDYLVTPASEPEETTRACGCEQAPVGVAAWWLVPWWARRRRSGRGPSGGLARR